MRRAAKRDVSETAIIDALRAVGADVEMISQKNVPDLLVAFRGQNWLLEVKTGKRKLSEGQREWHQNWRGQCAVVRTVDEALRVIGAIE